MLSRGLIVCCSGEGALPVSPLPAPWQNPPWPLQMAGFPPMLSPTPHGMPLYPKQQVLRRALAPGTHLGHPNAPLPPRLFLQSP